MGKLLRQLNDNKKKESSNLKYFFHFISKALLYTVICLFFIVVILFLVYFVDKVYNENHTGKRPLFNAYVIVSPSMVPTIKINDAVVVFRWNPKNLKVGDIITFSSTDPSYSGLTVTHRIVAKNYTKEKKYVFTTKGDHNNTEDSALVQEEDIYGKVIFRIPKLGYIRSFLTKPIGFLIFILLPTLGIIIYDIIKLIKKLKLYFQLKNSDDSNSVIKDKKQDDDLEVL